MNENELVADDEFGLYDLWQTLQAGWRYVLGGVVIGVIGAGAMIVLTPAKYEAVAVVQVGQVGQVRQVDQGGQMVEVTSHPVEPASQTIERMKTSAFQLGVAEKLGTQAWVADLRASTNATGKYISPQLMKGTIAGPSPLIELKTTGDSAEYAKNIASASVLELANRQAEIAKPMIDKLRLDLKIAREKLASVESELEVINKLVTNVGVKDDRFTQLSLMTTLGVQKKSELFTQRQLISALETALMPPATQSAKAIEEIFVTEKPVSPKKGMLIALGLIGGLLVGGISVFVIDAVRRATEQRVVKAASAS